MFEDDPLLRVMYRRLFERHLGCRVEEAHDGASGLALVRERRPHLVVLDVNLPDMSGVEVLETIRNEPAIADTPCVAITGENQRLVIEQLVSGRVLDILLKPMVLTRDLPRLERVLMKALPTAV